MKQAFHQIYTIKESQILIVDQYVLQCEAVLSPQELPSEHSPRK